MSVSGRQLVNQTPLPNSQKLVFIYGKLTAISAPFSLNRICKFEVWRDLYQTIVRYIFLIFEHAFVRVGTRVRLRQG